MAPLLACEAYNVCVTSSSRLWGDRYEPDVYSDGSAADEPLQKLLAANAAGGDREKLRQVGTETATLVAEQLMGLMRSLMQKKKKKKNERL